MCVVVEKTTLRVHLVAGGGDVISRIPFNPEKGDWFAVSISFSRNQISVQRKLRDIFISHSFLKSSSLNLILGRA